MVKGKTIIVGITGGIAAYKAIALCSKLAQSGAEVHVIMTKSAAKFVTELTLQTITRHPVYTDTFDERDPSVVSHIDLADRADLVVIAPATANAIAKMTYGLADDMLSTTLLATTAPIVVAPAMNVHMYEHPTVVANMETLRKRGVMFVEPGFGQLACGYVGKGRLAEPEEIFAWIESFFARRGRRNEPLKGRNVLVTAGGTIERIDPVRYITNDSSGKMGFAIAEAAHAMGARVHLIAANAAIDPPSGIQVTRVVSAQDMFDAVMRHMAESDIIVKAAAVADYRPVQAALRKIKKSGGELTLHLEKTPDILQEVGARKTTQYVIGFAAETDNLEQYAMDKLRRKNCDLLVANDVTAEGAGFGKDTNIVQIYDRNGLVETLPQMAKSEVAFRLLQFVAGRLAGETD
ncbi:bifunctional phosphopantothenoylcysteine decarboxylase/phosphopantothenate--cysteine ligase CoaBC [Paenibacillus sp. MSJ-34]|uniref:bifunctional phosphopantothenoylcysteine decarboxylase/phosphopantothenate--cysteine ligase CoaBC n=1 Tax=Paenibacillus sp. MSJ-34 TaxID=2841529 RepID=UPI001C0FA2C0|nr:bifunctional phosphopantothenoylcysteine decarboxylase/phosphopantothenate--cysteine ligase CoaBC [Paenibacillus sp. MSJ-34]MBU5444258.1 bifunctional phosphopantothenoylcysteine decarboxylase/phosphopantothenate--cysteine ligase CoaBC [Paenibacillus sp. MSJ-34]